MDHIPERPPITENTKLGSGNFGSVSAIKVGDQLRAIKIGNLGPLEVEIALIASKHLVKYISHSYKKGLEGHLITSLAPNRLEKKPTEALPVAIFLCKALEDIKIKSGYSYVHRDIKDSNIVISAKKSLKLIDWGCAIASGTKPEVVKDRMYTPSGTPGYIPPEGYDDEKPITEKFDSWAIGITMYKLLSDGKLPYYDSEGNPSTNPSVATMALVLPEVAARFKANLDALPIAEGVPEIAYTVMKKLLEINPEDRLSPIEALAMLKYDEPSPLPVSSPLPAPSPMPASSPSNITDLRLSVSPAERPPIAKSVKIPKTKKRLPSLRESVSSTLLPGLTALPPIKNSHLKTADKIDELFRSPSLPSLKPKLPPIGKS